jgi:hypothetical protein
VGGTTIAHGIARKFGHCGLARASAISLLG